MSSFSITHLQATYDGQDDARGDELNIVAVSTLEFCSRGHGNVLIVADGGLAIDDVKAPKDTYNIGT